jgi:Mrp family chromosome partitioning ATPase
MHEIFGLRSTRGVVDALKGEHGLREICQEPLPESGPMVLTAGALPPDPGELLDSRLLSKFFARLKQEFEYVLVDSPPMGFVSDPIVLATQADGVLLTLDTKKTSKSDVYQAMRSLRMVGANVLGTVVSNAEAGKNGHF